MHADVYGTHHAIQASHCQEVIPVPNDSHNFLGMLANIRCLFPLAAVVDEQVAFGCASGEIDTILGPSQS